MIINVNPLILLRRELHQNPESSNQEENTMKRLLKFIRPFKPDLIYKNLGGFGLAVVFKGKKKGPVVMFRADMDALPVAESNEMIYKSLNPNTSHKCGHDGHMTILAGLAKIFSEQKPEKGKVVLLFQPAEETAEGAKRILSDPSFNEIKPDYIFSLHNLPGIPKGRVIYKPNGFTASSKGLKITFDDTTRHASDPRSIFNPAIAMAKIIVAFHELRKNEAFKDEAFISITHMHMGQPSFGISPGFATLHATLRAFRNDDMDVLSATSLRIISEVENEFNYTINTEIVEEFKAVVNDEDCVKYIRSSANLNGMESEAIHKGFRWSEDFSEFTSVFKGAMFCLGAGENTPPLHDPNYDFPDELIEQGVKIFHGISRQILTP